MIRLRKTAPHIREVVRSLQVAGYETYIVGGAVRDLLLDRIPKDYDISTAATPQEVRNVFGRRQARIIGKRFRLVHLHAGREIIEISTFRCRPKNTGEMPAKLVRNGDVPDNMLFEDNDFGTAQEDAFRRDFTVNALFYDPVMDNLIDFTGMGLRDIENGIVRIIGDGCERFEEDPVRLLRALKLVGQYGFSFAPETEEALNSCISLIQHAAPSRLSLEMEKILISNYSDRILAAFQRYGFLNHFLPLFAERWDDPQIRCSMQLLNCRNRRIMAERYRNSISVAAAALSLPLVAEYYGVSGEGELWDGEAASEGEIIDVIYNAFAPHSLVKRVIISAAKMIYLQPFMLECKKIGKIASLKSFSHARELLYMQNELWWHRSDLIEVWEHPKSAKESEKEPYGAVRKKSGREKRKTSRNPEQ